MANRRQHYLPHFLLRRFGVRSGRWEGHTWRLDKANGTARAVVPKTEAAEPFYYDLPGQVLVDPDTGQDVPPPEHVIQIIESGFASAIIKLEAEKELDGRNVWSLGLFAALQSGRTPTGRAQLRFLDELLAKETSELKLSARKQTIEYLRSNDPSLTEEEAEQQRLKMIDDLQSGRVFFRSTPEREICLMLMNIDEKARLILEQCDWIFARFSGRVPLVLSDVGLTRYDPAPRNPLGGAAFLSGPFAETVINVSPEAALVIVPGSGRIGFSDASDRDAEDLNLRSYAASEERIYGASQPAVVDAHRLAKRFPQRVAERRPRPPVMWFGEGNPEKGPVLFTGHSTEGVKRATFVAAPGASRGQPSLSAEDLWRDDKSR